MKILMKHFEKLAGDYARRFTKSWDYYCIATGAYLTGFRDARQNIEDASHKHDVEFGDLNILDIGNDLVEVEYFDGEHQLTTDTFKKWQKEVKELPFKESLKLFLEHFEFNDIRVHESEDGIISFQGTCKKR